MGLGITHICNLKESFRPNYIQLFSIISQMQPPILNGNFYKLFFHIVLLITVISAAYATSLKSSWHFDDNGNIVENPRIHIRNLSWGELSKAVYSPLGENKITRPVALLSFALNYYYNGLDPVGYHVVNIVIHIITALFVYLVFFHTCRILGPSEKDCKGSIEYLDIALLGAALWALHPIQTQAVTYIVQRMASMATMFYMAAFYCYLQFRLRDNAPCKIVFLLLSFVSWLLALGCKENALILPLALIAYELAFFRGDWPKKIVFVKYVIILLIIILLAGVLINGEFFYDYLAESYSRRIYTIYERLFLQPVVLIRYLFLLLYPVSDLLILEPHIVPPLGFLDFFKVVIANIAVSFLLFVSFFSFKKYPVICFALIFYFVNHAIESSFLPLEMYFEHRNYLPSIFIYFAIAYYALKFMSYYELLNKRFMRSIVALLVCVFLTSEGMATIFRNDIWENELTLHQDTLDKSPESIRPYIAIAVTYMKDADTLDKALEYLKDIEKIYMKSPDEYQQNWVSLIYMNAATIYKYKKEYDKAIGLLLKSSEIYRYDMKTYINLGALFFEKGDYESTETAMVNANLLNNANLAEPYIFHGRALYEQKKYDLAIEVYRKGLELHPERDEFSFNLVACYLKQGDITQAKAELAKIPFDEQDIIYILYRALLYPGIERERLLKKNGELLASKNVKYCDWINDLIANKYLLIVYPEISSFELQLRQNYIGAISDFSNEINAQINKTNMCVIEYSESL